MSLELTLAEGLAIQPGSNWPKQDFTKSTALQERFHAAIPGGSHTYAKGDDQYPEWFTSYMVRGKGCHVWDVDGNEFIEYGMGLRSVTLGHAFQPVIDAIVKELPNGVNFGRPATIELEAAEKLLEMIPGMEMVKFGKNGSDATSAAIWLARAYTGRKLVAICGDQPFFSIHEWFIGTTTIDAGIPSDIKDLTVKFHYNDLASVQALFDQYPGQIACFVLEAEREVPPQPGFLQSLKNLVNKNGALLVYDEIVTGFRFCKHGAGFMHGVMPDLAAFGKAMGNGYSVSALVGKREFMRLGSLHHTDKDRVFLLSTTYGAEYHHLAAAMAVMDFYQNNDVVGRLYQQGARLRKQVEKSISEFHLENQVPIMGRDCSLFYGSRDENGNPSQVYRTLFLQEMVRRGIIAPSLIVSYSHSDEDIDRTAEAIHETLAIYRNAIDEGPEKYLIGRPVQSVYRKRNIL